MKKRLLSLIGVLTIGSVFAQTPSPSWSISQNASFTVPAAGTNFLDAIDANVLWLCGYDGFSPGLNYGWFSRTIDGGNNYNSGNIFSDTNSYVLANMEGIDANTAWASAYTKSISAQGGIFRTTDGGNTWVNMTAPGMYANAQSFCNMVSFFTPSIGVTMGDPVNNIFEFWRTTDGGTSWTQIPAANIPPPINPQEFGIVDFYGRLDNQHLWYGTNQGRVYRTNDAGLTWSVSVVTPIGGTVRQFAFTDPMKGICIANTATPNAVVQLYNTVDGGATWNLIGPVGSIPNFGYNDICNVPGTNVLVSVNNPNQLVPNGLISYSKDNGLTWTDWGSVNIPYLKVDFANNHSAWAGSFSHTLNPSQGGIWKYSGIDFNSIFNMPNNICLTGPNTTVMPTNNSAGNPPISGYQWSASPAGVQFSNPTSAAPVITFSNIGTYTISLGATNSQGTSTSTMVVNVLSCQAPSSSFSLQTAACTNYSFTATNTSTGSPSPTYMWSISPAANSTLSSATATNPGVTLGAAGVYTVSLVATNPSGSVQSTHTVQANICAPQIAFTIPSVICVPVKSLQAINSSSNHPDVTGSPTYTWNISPAANITYAFFSYNTVFNFHGGLDTTAASYTIKLTAKNASGTSTLTQVVTFAKCADTTGTDIKFQELATLVKMYPNPARESVNIELPDSRNITVRLTNVLGTVLQEERNYRKQQLQLNLSKLPAGIYFITVESGIETATLKFIHE